MTARSSRSRTRVVVAGGGFGGIYAALYLCGDDPEGETLEVTLVSERNHFTFTPLLHEVLGGSLSGHHCAAPYRTMSPGPSFSFVQGRVEAVDPDAGRVETTAGSLPFDYLVLALGTRPARPVEGPALDSRGGATGETGLRLSAFHWIPHASALHDRVLELAERATDTDDAAERRRLLTFVVGGGGPAGVEVAGELLHLLHRELPRHYRRLDEARVVLAHGGEHILEGWDRELAEAGQEQLREAGLSLRLETFIDRIEDGAVRFSGGEDGDDAVEAATLIDAMGVRPNSECLAAGGLPLDEDGYVEVDEYLRVEGSERIFCVGDLNNATHPRHGHRYPNVAPIALSQGARAAFNILSERGGWEMERYGGDHAGKIVSLGGRKALVDVLGLRLSGRTAWWVNRISYLVKLVGARNKGQAAATLLLNRIFTRNLVSDGILR